jgi:hypothetical protein
VSSGWHGAAIILDSSAPLALVLRSWEERFGARLMHLGFDTMALLVERPVPDADEALSVGAEHFALCTDNMTSWWFWWD